MAHTLFLECGKCDSEVAFGDLMVPGPVELEVMGTESGKLRYGQQKVQGVFGRRENTMLDRAERAQRAQLHLHTEAS